MMKTFAPILPLASLLDAVAKRRDHRHGVVLANGAFDLLHVGHVRYLMAAKNEGHLLVVAINSDASVRAAKGSDRPIVPAHERAEMVAALYCVDFVTVFEAADVRAIIAALKPDVHAKGTDYTAASVPEGDLVRAQGGRVAIVGDAKNHATSELLARMRLGAHPAAT